MTIETLPPDGYLTPRRYKVTAVCNICGGEFHWITTKLDGKDRPCPKRACKDAVLEAEVERRARNLAKMLEEQRAPAQIGKNKRTKAIDATANIVMEDHHMTNLNDNIRPGEAMAPKLAPHLQKQADGFFGGGAAAGGNSAMARRMNQLGQRALAGAYRGRAVTPGQLFQGEAGTPALRPMRTEVINPKRGG